jgi:methylated-DNA-[protein]-cysteine S-methyltransferase
MKLYFDRLKSPLGNLLLVWDGPTLRALDFGDYEDRFHTLLSRQYPDLDLTPASIPTLLSEPLEAYFAGELTSIDQLQVATNGTAFQQRVWAELRKIPAGTTISYGGLARQIGTPDSSRAVGLANGFNPIGIVVPCHRVIGSSGNLTGYGGGIERKRWLLAHEGVTSRLLLPV